MKIKIKQFTDAFFSFLLFFSVFWTVLPLGYGKAEKLAGAIALTLLCQYVYLDRSTRSGKKARLQAQMRHAFVFAPIRNEEWIADALAKRYEVKREEGAVVCGEVTVCVSLSPSPLSYAAVAGFFKTKKTEKLLILCLDCDRKAKALALKLQNTQIWEEEKVFALLSCLDALPPQTETDRKPSLHGVWQAFAQARLSRPYLASAAVILAASAISPFRNAYVWFAAVVCCVALLPPLLAALFRLPKTDES